MDDISRKIDALGLSDQKLSEVQTTWRPEAFTWVLPTGNNAVDIGSSLNVSKSFFRLSHQACQEIGLLHGDAVEVGFNKAFLALRKGDPGFIAKSRPNAKKSKSLFITSAALYRTLYDHGLRPGYYKCNFDSVNSMLVIRLPEIKATEAKPQEDSVELKNKRGPKPGSRKNKESNE